MYISAALFSIIIIVIGFIDYKKQQRHENEIQQLKEKHEEKLNKQLSKQAEQHEKEIENFQIQELSYILQCDDEQARIAFKTLKQNHADTIFWSEKSHQNRLDLYYKCHYVPDQEDKNLDQAKAIKSRLLKICNDFITEHDSNNEFEFNKNKLLDTLSKTFSRIEDLYKLEPEIETKFALETMEGAIYDLLTYGEYYKAVKDGESNCFGSYLFDLYVNLLDYQISLKYINEDDKLRNIQYIKQSQF